MREELAYTMSVILNGVKNFRLNALWLKILRSAQDDRYTDNIKQITRLT